MVNVSIIGCGHLGSAVIRGLARSGSHTITACDVRRDALEAIEDVADRTTTDLDVAAEASVVIIAVKPDVVGKVLDELDLEPDQTVLSFAVAVPSDYIEKRTEATVIRAIPNLAAEMGMMACAYAGDLNQEVKAIFETLGEYVRISEADMDLVSSINGSGPAFVYYLIKAFVDVGVERGLDPDAARLLAAQTFKGASETVLRSDRELEDLIDSVCSEGGTTIEGMEVLWDSTIDVALREAIDASTSRAAEITKDLTNE